MEAPSTVHATLIFERTISRHSNFIRMAIKRSSRVRFSLCRSLGKIWFMAMKTASTPPSRFCSSTFGARTLGKRLVRYSQVVATIGLRLRDSPHKLRTLLS